MHNNYDAWGVNEQWNYERGRAWATVAPENVPLMRAGKLSPEAISWFARHGRDIL
jgi:hypothetical protein